MIWHQSNATASGKVADASEVAERMVSTGVGVDFEAGRWQASLRFSKRRAGGDCVVGEVRSSDAQGLSGVIDAVLQAAAEMNVLLLDPILSVPHDGEGAEHGLPRGWRSQVRKECVRLGWRQVY